MKEGRFTRGMVRPEQKVLKAFSEEKASRLYFNELKRKTGLADSSLSRTLRNLTAERLLRKEEGKALTYYILEDDPRIPLEFSLLDAAAFSALRREVRIPLQRFLEGAAREQFSLILFGSALRLDFRKESDIDLLLIAQRPEALRKRVGKLQEEIDATSSHRLSIAFTAWDGLKTGSDPLVEQALASGLAVKGHQAYHEACLRGEGRTVLRG
jgi:predicted nucleotidyltransferase